MSGYIKNALAKKMAEFFKDMTPVCRLPPVRAHASGAYVRGVHALRLPSPQKPCPTTYSVYPDSIYSDLLFLLRPTYVVIFVSKSGQQRTAGRLTGQADYSPPKP